MIEHGKEEPSFDVTRERRNLNMFSALTTPLVQEEHDRRIAEGIGDALKSLWGQFLWVVVVNSEQREDGWIINGLASEDRVFQRIRTFLTPTENFSEPGAKLVLDPRMTVSLDHQNQNLSAFEVLPIRTGKKLLGALFVGLHDTGDIPQLPRLMMDAITNHLAMVLDAAHSWRLNARHTLQIEADLTRCTVQLERKRQEQCAIRKIQRAVSMRLDGDALFVEIVGAIRHLVPFDYMAVSLDLENGQFLADVIELRSEQPYCHPGATFPYEGTVTAWVLEHQQSFVASTLQDLRPFPVEFDWSARQGAQSLCAVPLIVGEKAVGDVAFSARTPRQYDALDLTFLEDLAAVCAVSLVPLVQAMSGHARANARSVSEDKPPQEDGRHADGLRQIVGESQSIRKVVDRVVSVAGTDSAVLISGETGTGKELVARAIHKLSQRKLKPLIIVNCAALPTTLIESELFGHEKGAFTGATARRIGRFELADGGTMFLDEIGDIPQEVQAKLLRVLQYQEFERVGGSKTIKVDVRVIAATNRALEKAMEDNTFRPDLYYRMNVFPIHIPPLRDRREDIPLLTQFFVKKYAGIMKRPVVRISQKAMDLLLSYSWPGNIRELESVIERSVILSEGHRVELVEDQILSSLNWSDQQTDGSVDYGYLFYKTAQKKQLARWQEVLKQVGGNRSRAARILGIGRTTLWRKLKAQQMRESSKGWVGTIANLGGVFFECISFI